ncbi:MAG: T9SS type A sorting domain-containing protein [Saprospiraceae bacterium]|nr:T9SS type A sorting domain-containing protein [Saprospiraceae bacterium]
MNTTISTPTRFARNVIVEPKVALVIESTVYMPQKGRIILQPGAILNINGGSITLGTFPDICNERTGDPRFWYGIEMQLSTTSSYPKLYCTNGTIEFSEMGIHNDSSRAAGNLFVNISNGTFRNNKHSIHILRGPYIGATPIFINKTRFYIDNSFPLSYYYTQVKIDNSKINFDSCKFDNPSTKHPLDSNSYCIKAMGATLEIQRTTFKDSLYGVQVLSAISPVTVNLTKSKFSNMFVGVNTTAGVNNYSITKDTFDTSWKYGILSTGCTGYNINNNLFNNSGFYNNSVGILMQESGTAENYIQKNVFSYLKYGDIAQGLNGDDNFGLQYRCNTHFNSISKDFLFQGKVSGFQGSRLNAAGNTSDGYVSFDLTSPDVSKINYYYRDISGERPTSTPSSKMNKVITDTLNCKLIGKPDSANHFQVYTPFKDTVIIRQDLYVDSIDGGNTSTLLSNIANATIGTANSVYFGVISKSPWLSADVALALYNRNDLYDSSKRAQILYKNPDLFRSGTFRSAVANASNPLPTSSLEALDTLTNYTTSRTNLETEISDLHQEMSALCFDKLNELKMDTIDNSDSIIVWLERADDYGSRRELVEVNYLNGDFTNASSALSDLGGLNGLTEAQTSDVEGLGDLLPYLIDVRNDDRYEGTLNDTEIVWMIDFVNDNSNQAGDEVKSLLKFYYDIDINGFENLRGSHVNEHGIPEDNVTISKVKVVSDGVNIYPNPSKDELLISLPTNELEWEIVILDLNGVILSKSITSSFNHIIDLSKMTTGVYLIRLTNGKGENISRRIQIFK